MTDKRIKGKIHAYQARMDSYHFRLPVTLIPSTAWGQNLRNVISQSQWQFLRLATFKRAQHRCQGCGARLGTNFMPMSCGIGTQTPPNNA